MAERLIRRTKRVPTLVRRPGRRISPEELERILEEMVTVKCAFCNGTGIDPFGLLSELSTCQVCGGRGEVRIRGPVTECKICGGTSIEPYTLNRLHCMACGGKGVVRTIEPAETCPQCRGTGVFPRRPPMYCHVCRGQGVIRRRG